MIIFCIFAKMKQIGEYISRLMKVRGLDQRDLALQCGMPYQNISAVLAGKRSLSVKQSIFLDDILGLEIGTLQRMQLDYEISNNEDARLPSSAKREILRKVKENGGLWSYDGIPESFSDDDIIEEGLRHLDFEDMHLLFELWSFSHIKRVWKQRLVSEGKRSNIINTLLGILYFKIDNNEIDGYLKHYSHP